MKFDGVLENAQLDLLGADPGVLPTARIWFDTALKQPRLYNGVGVMSLDATAVVSKTANYTATLADDLILCSAAAFTVTLPTAVGNKGKRYRVMKTDASFANLITVKGNLAELINFANTLVLCTQGDTVTVVSDGAQWWVLARRWPTGLVAFTPTFTGFGTATAISFSYARVAADRLLIQGGFSSGAPTAVEARITLPVNGSALTASVPAVTAGAGFKVGAFGMGAGGAYMLSVLAEPATAYLTAGIQNAGNADLTKGLANGLFTATTPWTLQAVVPITGWG